jgi:hypothetical protein
MVLVLSAIVTCALAAAPGGQGRRAMTIEDLIVAPRIADTQLSPDGTEGADLRRQEREHGTLVARRQAYRISFQP